MKEFFSVKDLIDSKEAYSKRLEEAEDALVVIAEYGKSTIGSDFDDPGMYVALRHFYAAHVAYNLWYGFNMDDDAMLAIVEMEKDDLREDIGTMFHDAARSESEEGWKEEVISTLPTSALENIIRWHIARIKEECEEFQKSCK